MNKVILTSIFFCLTTSLWGQSFKYDLHDNTGEGKLDRLNGIEAFLNKLDDGISKVKMSLETDRKKENQLLSTKIDDLSEKEVKPLTLKVAELEKSLGDLKKEFNELKKKVEDDDRLKKVSEDQNSMKKDIGDLKGSLKSIQELMKVYESLGNRGKPIN